MDYSVCNFIPNSRKANSSFVVFDFINDKKITKIDLHNMLCQSGICNAVQDNVFIFGKGAHLSKRSSYLGENISVNLR